MSGDRPKADLGRRLRQARERRGLSLTQVAASTKISLAILEALERDDIAKLPGGFFGRAFVRSFAEAVGLDPDEAAGTFDERSAAVQVSHNRPQTRVDDNDAFESNRQIATTFVTLAAISAPIAGLILYLTAVGVRPQTQVSTGAASGHAETATTTAVSVAASDDTRVVVGVLAIRPCQLTFSADGEAAVERSVAAGERLTIEMLKDLTVTTDDGGALALMFDGADARPLGGRGEPVTVRFNRDNYKSYLVRR
jgi:cytoskeletal protein RodZ